MFIFFSCWSSFDEKTDILTRRMSVRVSPDNSCINLLTLKCRGKRSISFGIMNNEVLNICIEVLYKEQKVLERLHGGFASCTKGS